MKTRKIPHISIIPAVEKSAYHEKNAATYISNYFQQQRLASTEILDPDHFQFSESSLLKPGKQAKPFKNIVKKIRTSSGILIIAPAFNGEYPLELKRIIDFLYEEWNHKPVAISTVSDDEDHQAEVIRSLQFALWKVNTWTVPVSFSVPGNHEASRDSDDFKLQQAKEHATESEFRQVFDNYCNKYIQLCTKVEYAV